MFLFEKVQCWFNKKKKYVLIGGTVSLLIIGTGVGYILYKINKIIFLDWMQIASKEELEVII